MGSNFIIFVLFAYLTQSSRAVTKTEFIDNFIGIKYAERGTVDQLADILDGYVEVIHLLANVSCGGQDYDKAAVNSTIEAIKQRQSKASNAVYDHHRSGLRYIAKNPAPLDADVEASYIGFAAQIALMHSPNYHFPIVDYSETLAAIESAQEDGIENIGNIWIAIYDLFETVVATDNVQILNVIEQVKQTAIIDAKSAFETIFAEYDILAIQFSDETQCQNPACLAAINSQRNLAVSRLVSEVHRKFYTIEYIAAANYAGDYQLIADYNKIHTAELSAIAGTEFSYEVIQDVLISATKDKKITRVIINTLRNKMSTGFFTVYANVLSALTYTQPQGSAIVQINTVSGYESLNGVINAILEAINLIGKTKTPTHDIEFEALENIAVSSTLRVFQDVYDVTVEALSSIDEDAATIIRAAWNTTTVPLLTNVVNKIFDGIKLTISDEADGTEAKCGVGEAGIKTAYTDAFTGFNKGLTMTFNSIRTIRLLRFFQANEMAYPVLQS